MKLISEEYREQNHELHKNTDKYKIKHRRQKYGEQGLRHVSAALTIKKRYECDSVLDYGCGKGWLSTKIKCQNYDPAIPKYSKLPDPAGLVVCTDVLEHIEPEFLDNVLLHLQQLTLTVAYFVIATRPDTSKTLPDGTNPHKIIESANWWGSKLKDYFHIESHKPKRGETVLVCTPL